MSESKKKIIFASDFHLGIDVNRTSKERELLIVEWLLSLQDEMHTLYLVGDIFDYWFEYKRTIPRGFSDFLSCLKQLRNKGIEIHMFTGNHDMWMFDYFTEEYGIHVHKEPIIVEADGQKIYVGHGDGLGPGDQLYKVIKSIFSNRICQQLFSLIHPTLALSIMKRLSQRDAKKYVKNQEFNPEKEWLITFAKNTLQQDSSITAFIFGHRHMVYDFPINNGSRVLNLGDWISYFSYAELVNGNLAMKYYLEPEKEVYI